MRSNIIAVAWIIFPLDSGLAVLWAPSRQTFRFTSFACALPCKGRLMARFGAELSGYWVNQSSRTGRGLEVRPEGVPRFRHRPSPGSRAQHARNPDLRSPTDLPQGLPRAGSSPGHPDHPSHGAVALTASHTTAQPRRQVTERTRYLTIITYLRLTERIQERVSYGFRGVATGQEAGLPFQLGTSSGVCRKFPQ